MPLRNIAALGVVYKAKKTEIGHIVFDLRKEENPCSLCARMRRGYLHDIANDWSCNKVALGHHADDAVETFIIDLFHEGRIGCFFPVTYLSRKNITVIRPMIYAAQRDVAKAAKNCALPIVKSECPADKATNRQTTKEFLHELERQNHGIKKRMLGALKRGHVSGW